MLDLHGLLCCALTQCDQVRVKGLFDVSVAGRETHEASKKTSLFALPSF